MSQPACPYCSAPAPVAHRRGSGLISTLFKVVLLYVALVVTSGTLINTHHPVAVESGRLIQTLTFVDPAIQWTAMHGYSGVARGLQALAHGIEFS